MPRAAAAGFVEDDRNDDRIFVVAGNDRRLRRRPAFVWFLKVVGEPAVDRAIAFE